MDGTVPDVIEESSRRPNTLTVLALLMGVALVFSWLSAYAFTEALIQAELVRPWSDLDPRPRWMLYAFAGLMSVFGAFAALFRQVSAHQLKRIDAMDSDDQA